MKGKIVVTSACKVDCFAICVTFPHEIASLTKAHLNYHQIPEQL